MPRQAEQEAEFSRTNNGSRQGHRWRVIARDVHATQAGIALAGHRGVMVTHGACAWMTIVVVTGLTHSLAPSWHGLSALWVSLVLIEDMALIGRVGFVRRRAKREQVQQ